MAIACGLVYANYRRKNHTLTGTSMPIDSGGSKGGAQGTRAPRVQILSTSCSLWEILAKSYVGAPRGGLAPLLGEILDLPLIEFFVVNPILSDRAILYRIGL